MGQRTGIRPIAFRLRRQPDQFFERIDGLSVWRLPVSDQLSAIREEVTSDRWEEVTSRHCRVTHETGLVPRSNISLFMRMINLTEVDWRTGAIVRDAKKLGRPTPLLETLYGLVKARELRVRSRITSRNWRPDLRHIRLRPIEQTGGIAGLLRGSAIEERPKMT